MPCLNSIKPVVKFDECSPVIIQSAFKRMYWLTPGQPFADLTALADLTAWAARLNESDTADTAIRELWGTGSKAVVTSTIVDIDNDRTVETDLTHPYQFIISDRSQENYDMARAIQEAGSVTGSFMVADDKFLYYGDLGGFQATITAQAPHTGNKADVGQIILNFNYKGALVKKIPTPFV